MDYEGPVFGLAASLYGNTTSKDHDPFQPPSDLDTEREDAERLS